MKRANKKVQNSIKIVAGKYKGRGLEMADISTTRSSKSILRESLFNSLSFEVVDSLFVEVFAGSGSIGFEALSRGAKKALFFEKNRDSFEVLKRNASKIDSSNSELVFGDSFELLPKSFASLEDYKDGVFYYFDPPFSTREGNEDIYSRCIKLIKIVPTSNLKAIIVEHLSSEEMPKSIGKLELFKYKKFGKSSLSYYQ